VTVDIFTATASSPSSPSRGPAAAGPRHANGVAEALEAFLGAWLRTDEVTLYPANCPWDGYNLYPAGATVSVIVWGTTCEADPGFREHVAAACGCVSGGNSRRREARTDFEGLNRVMKWLISPLNGVEIRLSCAQGGSGEGLPESASPQKGQTDAGGAEHGTRRGPSRRRTPCGDPRAQPELFRDGATRYLKRTSGLGTYDAACGTGWHRVLES